MRAWLVPTLAVMSDAAVDISGHVLVWTCVFISLGLELPVHVVAVWWPLTIWPFSRPVSQATAPLEVLHILSLSICFWPP